VSSLKLRLFRPPADWGELVQADDDRAIFQASPDELPVMASQATAARALEYRGGERV